MPTASSKAVVISVSQGAKVRTQVDLHRWPWEGLEGGADVSRASIGGDAQQRALQQLQLTNVHVDCGMCVLYLALR